MTCKACAQPFTFNLLCLPCCARLVASARPSRSQQEALLAAIARNRDAPKRQAILEAMRER